MAPSSELAVALRRAELIRFHPLLQRGVGTRVAPGRPVLAFLVEDLGLDPGYVRRRITTVFLDGEVVDILEDATLAQGARLALSAAMPGLVGATLRRGGAYAAMRAAITRPTGRAAPVQASAPAVVRVKLFNMLLDEIGPAILARGIVLGGDELAAILGDLTPGACPRGEEVEVRVRFS